MIIILKKSYLLSYMTTMYSPKNVDQTFILIIYPNNVYMLSETELEKEQPMYMGKDRIKMEAILNLLRKNRIKNNIKILI